ncbi:MAG TPA: 50S ribosomal protein L11 methyltransferase, partial [Hyphomicrobiaceae bacterium]|nr:50S ribosomal protein L11 methyltransferase [Hyphomicrobiaceae bacterium]
FHKALASVVVPGKTVFADIGCGTGFLGFMAAKLGAKKVFLLETAEIAALARKLARENGLRNVEIVPAHSTEVEPPERAHVVVSETLGNYAFEENIIETLGDARDRYLEPGGVMIPGKVEQMISPVVSAKLHRDLSIWSEVGYGLTFDAARAMGLNNIYVRWLAAEDLLDGGRSAITWDKVDFARPTKTTRSGGGTWTVSEPQTITGLALWWRAELVPGISLGTGPFDPRTHWEQLYLPVLDPMPVAAGETIDARVRSTTSYDKGTNVRWTISIRDRKGKERATQSMDLNRGFLP